MNSNSHLEYDEYIITMNVPDELFDGPIDIESAASFFRTSVNRNEPPLDASVKKLNNKMVADWKNSVLRPTCDPKGNIPSSRVFDSWQSFAEGRINIKMVEFVKKGMFPEPPREIIQTWADILKNSTIEELWEYTVPVVMRAWTMLDTAMKQESTQRLYDELFSVTDDPKEWEYEFHNYKNYFKPEYNSFGLSREDYTDINEKIKVLLRNPIRVN